MTKMNDEIKKFVDDNSALSGPALSGLILKNFNIKISQPALLPYLQKARAEKEANNSAKVEAVRSKILDDADRWANKYLQYTDDEIESLRKLIKGAEEAEEPVKLETARDRLAASAALNKMLSTIIDFVKPEPKTEFNVNLKPDLSKLSVEDLRLLRDLKLKLEGDRAGTGEP